MKTFDQDEWVWSQKYRPQTIDDCILPESTKNLFVNILKQGEFQSILMSGVQGSGKTTSAIALCKDLGLDYLLINASEENGIDTLRTKIKQFASTVSVGFDSPHKVVILDESDHLTNNFQGALRALLEQFSKNCRFILTANYKSRIIPAIQSRCTNIDFNPSDFKTPKMMKQMLRRIEEILSNEGVEYEKQILSEIIIKWVPDFRRTINEIQKYSVQSGVNKIDSGILIQAAIDVDIRSLVKILKERNFKAMREWVAHHSDLDLSMIARKLYDSANDTLMKPETIPHLVLILAEYQYRDAFVVDKEINLAAALTEIMKKCEFV